MAQQWFIEAAGRVDGPVTSRELQHRAAAGKLRPTDRVSPDRRKWVPAAKVRGLTFPQPTAAPEETIDSDVRPRPLGPDDVTPDVLPGYIIDEIVGSGSFGVVYRARQVKLDRVVAVKTFTVGDAAAAEHIARFEKEARALARLQHPNIVSVYDTGRAGRRVFFAMELLTGEDLGRRLARVGRLDERTTWLIARQTAAGLTHAAAAGITHRDVKPANLFICPAPTGSGLPAGVPMVKVTDFGLALTRPAGGGSSDDRLTATGVILGTPVYMAPEQFRGSDLDHRADIYALGATVYHALAGKVPFDGSTAWDVMAQKIESQPRLGPPVSAESAELVAAMMAPDPADRIGTYEELIARIDQLACVRGGDPPTVSFAKPRPAAPPRSGRRRWAVAGGIAAAMIVVAVGIGLAVGGRSGETPGTDPPPTATFVTTGLREELYDGTGIVGWTGPGVQKEEDEDLTPVLAGTQLHKSFRTSPHYRLTLGVDPSRAATVDVGVTVPNAPADAPWVALRITPDGRGVVGTRAGRTGGFVPHPQSTPVVVTDPRRYREVRFERTGGEWRAFFDNRPVAVLPDDGSARRTEVQVIAEGGPVRIESAVIEELAPAK